MDFNLDFNEIDPDEYNRLIDEATQEILNQEVEDVELVMTLEEAIVDILRKGGISLRNMDISDKKYVTIVNIWNDSLVNREDIEKDFENVLEDLEYGNFSVEHGKVWVYGSVGIHPVFSFMLLLDKEYDPDEMMLKLSGSGNEISISENQEFCKEKLVELYFFTIPRLWGNKDLLKNPLIIDALIDEEFNEDQKKYLPKDFNLKIQDSLYITEKINSAAKVSV